MKAKTTNIPSHHPKWKRALSGLTRPYNCTQHKSILYAIWFLSIDESLCLNSPRGRKIWKNFQLLLAWFVFRIVQKRQHLGLLLLNFCMLHRLSTFPTKAKCFLLKNTWGRLWACFYGLKLVGKSFSTKLHNSNETKQNFACVSVHSWTTYVCFDYCVVQYSVDSSFHYPTKMNHDQVQILNDYTNKISDAFELSTQFWNRLQQIQIFPDEYLIHLKVIFVRFNTEFWFTFSTKIETRYWWRQSEENIVAWFETTWEWGIWKIF